jgi:hypothetical protein
MNTNDDPSWSAYPNTLLSFCGGDLVVDLRVSLPPAQIERLHQLELGPRFAVLTAHNPRGRIVGIEENNQLHRRLEARLREAAHPVVACDGMDPSVTHIEPGFAVALSTAEAKALAIKFEQSAFFEFDGGQFWLVPGLVEATPTSLPARCGAR